MTDIYKAPAADLAERTTPFEGNGSLENGIAGKYDFTISGVLGEAWRKTSGSKGTSWGAFVIYFVVIILVSIIVHFALRLTGLSPGGYMTQQPAFAKIITQVVQTCLTLPLTAGLFMLGIKLAVRAPVEVTEIFQYYGKVVPLLVTTFLMYLMIAVGLLLLVLPGIYLAFSYYMALPLVLEKNLSPWQALEASRKAITHHWFKFFFTYLAMMLIVLVSAIPFGIGWIWTMPMMLIVGGVLYTTVFGYDGETNATPD